MDESAEVVSIAALRDFGASLAIFQDEVRKATAAADMEVRRGQDWIESQMRFWEKMKRECEEEVSKAKIALHNRKSFKLWDRPPDCSEQEEDVERAERRLAHAEQRLAACKKWRLQYLKAVEEFESPLRRLQGYSDIELERATALLKRMSETLETYAQTAPGGMSESSSAPAAAAAPATPATPANQEAKP